MIGLAAVLFGTGVWVIAVGVARREAERRASLARILEMEVADPSVEPEALVALARRAGTVAARTPVVASVRRRVRHALTRRRARRIEEQLPQTLQLLASCLDSGSSVLHALELAAEEGDEPIRTELARVVGETRVGRELTESLDAMAHRVGSRDLDWTVEAVRIQTETGGKLADVLRVLADFMRARVEVRGEVRALSAEARLSGRVLIGLPLVLSAYLFTFRRSYIEPLYTTGAGRAMLLVALGGILLGSLWMRRIVRVEV